jgi:hypothetical protein
MGMIREWIFTGLCFIALKDIVRAERVGGRRLQGCVGKQLQRRGTCRGSSTPWSRLAYDPSLLDSSFQIVRCNPADVLGPLRGIWN